MVNTYLSFVVYNEFFAVNVIKVLEVLQKQKITHVPNTPGFIKGIINFRGEIVPVFESRIKFNLPDRADDQSYVIIVLDLSKGNDVYRIGAIVDRVKDVITIDDNAISPVPPISSEFNTEFLQGIYRRKDEFILLLDIDKIFTGEEQEAFTETKKTEDSTIS
jgi:purine-binding chemotaxis protein CheW